MQRLSEILNLKLKKLRENMVACNDTAPNEGNFLCPSCRDRGVILIGEKASRCECMKQKAILNKFKYANIGRQLRHFTFDKFNFDYYSSKLRDESNLTYREKAQRAYETSKQFVQKCLENRHVHGLLFSGPVGSGKTFMSSAIANELLDAGKEVLFVVVPDFLDQIKATYSQNVQTYSEIQLLESARNVEVLILDDLGAHNYTDWTRNKIYSIINYRLNNTLPTVITTNLELEVLEEYLGERTTSRLLQLCKIYSLMVECDIRYQKRLFENKK